MRQKVIEALVARDLHGPYLIRQILKGGHPTNRKRFLKREQPKYIKGVYNGQYFRVQLPQASAGFPRMPSFPSILPVPISVGGVLSESPKYALETLFPVASPDESVFQRFWKWCTINWPTMLLNLGSICTLLAFTRSDVLELRTLSATGSISNAIYRYSQKPILWITVVWPSLFATVNGVKIMEILHERNAEVHMDETQERIYVEYFLQHGVTPKQFQRIEQSTKVLSLDKGVAIIRKGETLNHIYLVVEGSTQAHILGRHLTAQSASASAKLNKLGGDSGAWVGEMTFLDKLGEKERLKSAPKNERQKTDQQQKEMNENSMDDRNKATNAESSAEIIKKVDETSESSESKDTIVLYTVLAKENCKVWRWSFEDMEVLMSSSTDLRGALTRAMTASIVGKVVNMTLSRTSAMPHWSTWLSDWVRDDDTKVQVTTETFPADLGAEEEIEEDHAIEAINQAIQQ